MSAFIIFAIVLTIAYVLYYTAMITIDLNARKRSETDTEESIAATDEEQHDEPIVPRSVIENTGGGFSFDTPGVRTVDNGQQDEQEDIEEASQEQEENHDESSEHEPESDFEETNEENEESGADEENEQDDTEDGSQTEGSQESSEEGEPEEADEDLPADTLTPDDLAEKTDDEGYDASDVFDPSLTQPKMGVTKMVGPTVSDVTKQNAEIINQSLMTCSSKSIDFSSSVFRDVVHNRELSEKIGIDITDEQHKF